VTEHAANMDAVAYWRQFPVTWDPDEPGETLVGKVEHLGETKLRDSWYPRVQVRTEAGELVTVIATQKQLLAKLVAAKPRVGDRIKIRYEGPAGHAAPGMNPTLRYSVAVRNSVTETGP
jgi:hypothetical protein